MRFAQHNGLRGGAKGTKHQNIKAYFANEHNEVGFTVLAISDLSQPDACRCRATLGRDARDVLNLNACVSAETMSEIRALEGRLSRLQQMSAAVLAGPGTHRPAGCPIHHPKTTTARGQSRSVCSTSCCRHTRPFVSSLPTTSH